MKPLLRAALVLAVAMAVPACRSAKPRPDEPTPAVDMKLKEYQVVWTRGGKLGYLRTFDVSERNQPVVEIHYVTDLQFTERGWIDNNGQAERFDYPEQRIGEAKRTIYERVPLPSDTLENQVRRILGVSPTTEIAIRPASEADLHR